MYNNDVVVNIVKKLTEKKSAPCKKTLQKIVYLIEMKGLDLGFDYGIHFYGPYSSDLDFAIRELDDQGKLEIEYTMLSHNISATGEGVGTVDSIVSEVIDEFGNDSASELELLSTALYSYSLIKDKSKILDGVVKIKGSKYTKERINTAIERLTASHYFS